ncbi:MAG: DUF4329 domain-containing protein [Pseudomonadota bacterium]
MRTRLAALLLLLLPVPAQAQDAQVQQVARNALTELQEPSFAQNREFCGVIGRFGDGRMAITPHRGGREASCTPRGWRGMAEILATYHTHGAYGPHFDNEVPSLYDLLSVMEERVNGYVSTPGGRFWFVDGRRGEARLICGPGCLPSDPDFRDDGLAVPNVLTLADLRARTRAMALR